MSKAVFDKTKSGSASRAAPVVASCAAAACQIDLANGIFRHAARNRNWKSMLKRCAYRRRARSLDLAFERALDAVEKWIGEMKIR